jgi:GDP/UDP-N,N'-diacetylbacillosamine 2-epimerase (hydrolysing)
MTKIIAEIGVNHNGSFDKAFELVNVAKESGVDVVKFQMGNPKNVIRQKGRLMADIVINCKPIKLSINEVFEKLSSQEFISVLETVKNPNEKSGMAASKIIVGIIKNTSLENIIKKSFYDLEGISQSG